MINKTFFRCLRILNKSDRVKLIVVIAIQIGLSLLDLIGVALIGILGALTVNGIQSRKPSGAISHALDFLGMQNLDFQTQAAYLGIAAGAILILRTLFSIATTRKTLFFLSARGAQISTILLRKYLGQEISAINKKTSQETLYAITNGVVNLTLGVIGNSVTLIADLSLLIVLFIGILVVNPFLALSTVLIFSSIALMLFKVLHKKAKSLGESQSIVTIESNEKIIEILQGFREIFVRNKRSFYAESISSLRFRLSKDLAESAFLPYIGKYVLETAVILAALLISAIQFVMSDAPNAIATMSIFLASATRIAPAVLRMQQSGLQIQSAVGAALPTLNMIEEMNNLKKPISISAREPEMFVYPGFEGTVEIVNVSYRYPNTSSYALQNVSVSIQRNEFIGIVGLSGAGKSTLADLILGLATPTAGSVSISKLEPENAIQRWAGAIAYVPQDPLILNASILENVALGYARNAIDPQQVQKVLQLAQLMDFIDELPDGINTVVGERGTRMSGGQKQRLSIARALYTNPKLILFDEATSSLDAQTEANLSEAISNLKSGATIIAIAHRLSTIKKADRIIYLEAGKINGVDNFENLVKQFPKFENQAKLMGLT